MKIYNAFSQTPTRNCTAAGIDFFVPNIDENDAYISGLVHEAFEKSYKVSAQDGYELVDKAVELVDKETCGLILSNRLNFIHFYYGLKDKVRYIDMKDATEQEKLIYFLNNVMTFDAEGRMGVICRFSDMLFINSGIKVALNPHTSLEFKNKSGKGCQGWSVKACLVDEDDTGYVHLSMQYLWYDDKVGTGYVGDKLTQGVVQPVLTDDAEEITLEEYNVLMENSQRGADGFGSSDVQH